MAKDTAPENERIEVKEAKRIPMSVRTTPALRGRIDHAAIMSGRSLAQEVEFRLELSFHDQDRGYQKMMDFIEQVTGAISDGDTGSLLMTLSRAIAAIEKAQGVPWCSDKANLEAYDLNLKDVMEGIRRVWLHRSEATISDYMALEHPFLMKDPPKMKD